MAFDDVAGADPRGPICPSCRKPILSDEVSTAVADTVTGISYRWHVECLRHFRVPGPYGSVVRIAAALRSLGFGQGDGR